MAERFVYQVVGTVDGAFDDPDRTWIVRTFMSAGPANQLRDDLVAWMLANGMSDETPRSNRVRHGQFPACPLDPAAGYAYSRDAGIRYDVDELAVTVPDGDAAALAWSVLCGQPDWGLLDKLLETRPA